MRGMNDIPQVSKNIYFHSLKGTAQILLQEGTALL